MERRLTIRSSGSSPITALVYQPVRREIITGHEDGVLKAWECDSGKQAATFTRHKGWVTDLLFWSKGKVLFSASVDGTIVQWSSAGVPFNTIEVGEPVFSLLWSPRREQLITGRNGGISIFNNSGKFASNGLPLLDRNGYQICGHEDMVRCLTCLGNKVVSAGYDRKLIIYEATSMPGDLEVPLKCICVNHNAHDAGITCLLVAKDTDSSTWIATGSFDKKVKIWTADGKIIHSIQCNDAVTGICFVPSTKVLWISAGTSLPAFYEPKSGDNISDYVPILGNGASRERGCVVRLLKYIPEMNEVIGTTNRKEVLSWKYNPSCCVCVQATQGVGHVETIVYTSKVPILIFTGSYDGQILKWERLQLNPFMYSQEPLPYTEQLSLHLGSEEGEINILDVLRGREGKEGGEKVSEEMKEGARQELMKPEYRGFLKSLFVESLDLLVASALDGKIFVWGYDQKTVALLTQMQRRAAAHHHDGNPLLHHDGSMPEIKMNNEKDCAQNQPEEISDSSVTSRVAGFTCLYILNGHYASVSGLALIERDETAGFHSTYLLSTGWDLTICLWDLESGSLVTQLKNCLPRTEEASDGHDDRIITDLDFCKERSVFAYASSDHVVYLRKFSTKAAAMVLIGTLLGHTREVTQVRWNMVSGQWVTGSEDGTIRTWNADSCSCEQIVSAGDPVSVLCIDKKYGCILATVQSIIKVYDSKLDLLQVSRGHTDSVRTVIHVPELDQYISAGWDHTVRIWSAYYPKGNLQRNEGET